MACVRERNRPGDGHMAWLQWCAAMVVLLAVLTGCASAGAGSWQAPPGSALEQWIDTELTPSLARQLATHPRFSGETIAIATLDGERLAPHPDALSARIRDRLRNNLAGEDGVRIAWAGATVRCRLPDGVNYVVGVALSDAGSQQYRAVARVLDRGEKTWVAGISEEWEGRLTRAERDALRRADDSEANRGSRTRPFMAGQDDRLAAALAADLVCQFGDKRLRFAMEQESLTDPDTGLAALIAGYLSGAGLTRVTKAGDADVVIRLRRHAIEPNLELAWVSARAAQQGYALPGAEAQAYVATGRNTQTEDAVASAPLAVDRVAVEAAPLSASDVVSAFKRLMPRQTRYCDSHQPFGRGTRTIADSVAVSEGECFDLELIAKKRVTVFLFRSHPARGLVPASETECRRGTLRGIDLHSGERLRWTDAIENPSLTWLGREGVETFYAVAAIDPQAAARLRSALDDIALACQRQAQADGPAEPDREWLARLDDVLRDLDGRVSWQALRLRHRG